MLSPERERELLDLLENRPMPIDQLSLCLELTQDAVYEVIEKRLSTEQKQAYYAKFGNPFELE